MRPASGDELEQWLISSRSRISEHKIIGKPQSNINDIGAGGNILVSFFLKSNIEIKGGNCFGYL